MHCRKKTVFTSVESWNMFAVLLAAFIINSSKSMPRWKHIFYIVYNGMPNTHELRYCSWKWYFAPFTLTGTRDSKHKNHYIFNKKNTIIDQLIFNLRVYQSVNYTFKQHKKWFELLYMYNTSTWSWVKIDGNNTSNFQFPL